MIPLFVPFLIRVLLFRKFYLVPKGRIELADILVENILAKEVQHCIAK
jgi:hypothetical protein